MPSAIVSAVGYRVIKRIADVEIPPNTGDFRLMSRRVVDNVVALEGEPRLPARARRLWSASARRACSTTATRAPPATGKYNRFFGSLVIGMNGIVGFSRYPLHLISRGRHRLLGVRVPARGSPTSC